MNGPQTRVEPLGRALSTDKPEILPGLPGGPPLLPADREVPEGQEGDLVLFDSSDVMEALRQFEIAAGDTVEIKRLYGFPQTRSVEAMRKVMMFALSIAALNVGVAPERPIIEQRVVETEIIPPGAD